MQSEFYRYLRFAEFKSIFQWDLKRYLNQSFKSKYSIVELGAHIKEESKKYAINEEGKQYGILGVNNQTGIFDAYTEDGSKIRQKYKRMETGWIAYNPYRVNVGSIGIKKQDDKYEYISPAYVVFSCQSSLSPEYLFLTMKTPLYNKVIRDNTTGSVRQNLSYDILKGLQIPLPSFSVQQDLITAYSEKIKKAEELEQQVEQIGQDIERYLLDELGIGGQKKTSSPNNGFKMLRFIKFKDANRWDVSFYSKKNSIGGKYEIATMEKCIDHFMQDPNSCTLRIETSKFPEKAFQYIGMESVEKGTGSLVEEKLVKGKEVKSQTIRVPHHYFLYGKLRPYLNKYWFNETQNDNIVCSSEFFVFSIKPHINEFYFKYYLASSAVQQQISNAFQGARMPRINESTFKAIQIPIPPIETQNAIVEHINEQKAQIKELKKQAEELRKEALEEFEKEIFE